jgi:hypothetical protein
MPIVKLLSKPLKLASKIKNQSATCFAIGSGEGANRKTVDVMIKLARNAAKNPKVQQLARKIVENIKSHNFLEECQVLGAWVQKNVRYVRDPRGLEQLTTPEVLVDRLKKGEKLFGDCDDMSLLLASLILCVGARPYFAIVKYYSRWGAFNHIYLVVYERNGKNPIKRLSLDPILKTKPIGFEVKSLYREEIPV